MRGAFAIIVLCVWAPCSFAAVTFNDATEYAGASVSSTAASVSFSATVNAGTHQLMLVGVRTGCVTACPSTPVTVTFNGDAFTEVISITQGTAAVSTLAYRLAPDVGSFNVVCDASNDQRIACGAIVADGVDQSSPLGTPTSASNGSTTSLSCPSVTVPADGGAVGTGGKNNTAEALVTATQTERWNIEATDTTGSQFSAGAFTTSTGSQTFTFTSTTARTHTCLAVPLNPAPTGGLSPGFFLLHR